MLYYNIKMLNLPSRALQLIHEYSKPVTRPDWRTFQRKIHTIYFIQSIEIFNELNVFKIVKKNMLLSQFYIAHRHIYYYGITSYVALFNEDINVILSNKWLNKCNEAYINYMCLHYNLYKRI